MKKAILFSTIITLLLLTACGGATTTSEATPANTGSETKAEFEPIKLRLAHVVSVTNYAHLGVEVFAEKVKEKTNGKVTLEIYPGTQLGGERDIVENIANGSLDMGAPTTGIFTNFTTAFTTFNMPFLFESDEVERQLAISDLMRKEAYRELEEKLSIKPLGILTTGFYQFGTSGKELHNLQDLKGLKFRAIENAMLIEAFEALSMAPTPMAFTEVFNAFETGVIESSAFPLFSTITDGYKDVVNHVSMINAYRSPHVLAINAEIFNGLPKEYQTAIVEAAMETEEYQYKALDDYLSGYMQQVKDLGITVAEDFDHTGIEERIQPLHEKYAAQDPFMKRAIELVREFNSKN